jgi:UDP-N-acetylglucosamine--N-acetylmuramyl-(pentapeptide) pyrophosphoryl-undecaprenol N-acetylglucosamine transferase
VVTGNPVRPEVLAGNADKAVAALGLDGFDRALPTVYVTGGAQGARQINESVADALPWLLERANVIHQCGPAAIEKLTAGAAELPAQLSGRYFLTGFVGAELPDVLALADVMISRSGAGTIAEITALGKAAVLIPLAISAGNEQAHNAAHLQQTGAAVALLGGVTPDALCEAVAPLLADPGRREEVARQARAHGRPEAAERLVDVLLSVVIEVRE